MYVWTLLFVANENPATDTWVDTFATQDDAIGAAIEAEAEVDAPAPQFQQQGRQDVATVEGGTYRIRRLVVPTV